MPITTSLLCLGMFVQIFVGAIHQFGRKSGKGKLTRLYAKLVRKSYWPPTAFRTFWQLLPMLTVELSLIWLPEQTFRYIAGTYWIIVIVLYMDDYFFGDDDQWKRRWEATKNKIKWLWTPQMEANYQKPR